MLIFEQSTFLSWLWLFCFMYYVASRELLFRLKAEKQDSEDMEKRKNMYRVVQLSNLIVLGILTIVLLSANTVGVNQDGFDALELIAAILLFSELLLNLVFFSMAICNFKALLKQMPDGVKISRI